MLFRKSTLYIYTDGSSLPKPRRGGMAVRYIFLDDSENEIRIDGDLRGNRSATNNQMELKAVIDGLKNIPRQSISINYNLIEVRTDSRYVVNNVNNAIYSWSKNKWANKNGRPIENALLWKELIKTLRAVRCRVQIKWVKGHSIDLDNQAVDQGAKYSAKSSLDKPIVVTKVRRKKSMKKTKIGSIEMKGQKIAIYIINEEYMRLQKLCKYRYEIISKGSKYFQNVDIIYSELNYLKAGHSYLVTFNKNSANPRILRCIKEIQKETNSICEKESSTTLPDKIIP